MSRQARNVLVAIMLGTATLSFVGTALAPIVHADDMDCSKDENKDKEECKK